MYQRNLFVTLLVAFAVTVLAEDKKIMSGQIEVHVMETSGGMRLTAKAAASNDDGDSDMTTPEPTAEAEAEAEATTEADSSSRRRKRDAHNDEANVVEIMLDKLVEVDSEGNVIGANKDNTQAVEDFSSVEFTINDANEESSLMYSELANDAAEISAVELPYERDLAGGGKVVIQAYIAKQAGTITLGSSNTEKTAVKVGQIKFTVHIEGWVWCTDEAGNCKAEDGTTNEVGAALDLSIKVKGKGEATAKQAEEGMSLAFDIGNHNNMTVSRMVKVANDDAEIWMAMAENYPMPEKVDDDTTKMTMRFPMFEKSMWYDPTVELKVPGSDDVSAASSVVPTSLAVLVTTILAVVWARM